MSTTAELLEAVTDATGVAGGCWWNGSRCGVPQASFEEAGGGLIDWRGRRTAFGGDTIATNGVLGPSVRTVLGAFP